MNILETNVKMKSPRNKVETKGNPRTGLEMITIKIKNSLDGLKSKVEVKKNISGLEEKSIEII